jgi:hypothetical protein
MKIEAADYPTSPATPELIRELLADDSKRGEYMILNRDDGNDFLQIAGDCAKDGFHIEYREGEQMFCCPDGVSQAEAESIFLEYLSGSDGWKTRFPWEPMEIPKHTGRNVLIVALVIVFLCLYLAAKFHSLMH